MFEKEFYTVSEFAELRGVSKQTIYQQLNKGLKKYLKVVEGKKLISAEALKEKFNQSSTNFKPTFKPTESQVEQPIFEILKEQIAEKDKQITELLEQLKQAQEQNKQLAELLKIEQEINKNNQVLIARAQEPVQIPEEAETPKRKGFFSIFKKNK